MQKNISFLIFIPSISPSLQISLEFEYQIGLEDILVRSIAGNALRIVIIQRKNDIFGQAIIEDEFPAFPVRASEIHIRIGKAVEKHVFFQIGV